MISCTISSMTGFGRATADTPSGRLTVEVRTLNSRHLEVAVKGPRELGHLEMEVRRIVRERFDRGKADVYLTMDWAPREFVVDRERASSVADALGEVAARLGDRVRLEHVLAVGDVLRLLEGVGEGELQDCVLATLGRALDAVVAHRQEEGRAMAEDVAARVQHLVRMADLVAKAAATAPSRLAAQVKDALSRLDMGTAVEVGRLEAEVALLAQRADVAEELTRLRTHLAAFGETLQKGGAVGRRLDFIIQEIGREINTIGSKAGAGGVASLVVEFKTELEKVREQIQNLE